MNGAFDNASGLWIFVRLDSLVKLGWAQTLLMKWKWNVTILGEFHLYMYIYIYMYYMDIGYGPMEVVQNIGTPNDNRGYQ